MGESSDGVGAGGVRKMGLNQEEIAKVKEEWEERQKRKQEKAKEKEKDKDKEKDADKKEGDKEGKDGKPASKKPTPLSSGTVSPAATPTPTHQRYTLHRDIFACF